MSHSTNPLADLLEKWSDGWPITAMRFALKFIDGNLTLEAAD